MLTKTKRLSIYILFFFFLFVMIVFARDNLVNNDNDKKLKEEILAVFISDGEKGLRDFAKEKIDNIYPKFIANFAEAGVNERKEDWLKISLILAEEKKDEKIIAFVHFEMSRYFISIGNYEKGIYYYEKALPILAEINFDFQWYMSLMKELIPAFKKEDVNKMEVIIGRELSKLEEFLGQANIYIWKGNLYAYKGDNLRALEMYDKAMSIFEKEGDFNGQGNVYLSKGDFYRYTDNYRKGLEMYDKALPFFEKTGNIEGQGKVYKGKGDIYRYTGENLKSFEMYDKALPFFEIASHPFEIGQIYMEKGNFYKNSNDNSKALEMYEKALDFFERTGVLYEQGDTYLNMGEVYSKNGENARALEMNKKALNFFKEANDFDHEGIVYIYNAMIYFETGDITLTLEMCENAINIYKRLEHSFFKGNVYIGIGMLYSKIGDSSKALEVYDKALYYYEKAGDLDGQSFAFYSKGEIYSEIYDYPRALEMYNKAFDLAKKTGDFNKQGDICKSIGCIYLYNGDYSRAIEMFKKSVVLINQKKDTLDTIRLVYAYGLMGDTYLGRNDYSKAMEMYKKEQALYEETGDNIGSGAVYSGKGDIYFRNGDYSRAMEMYENALPFYKRWHFTGGRGSVYSKMGDIHLWTGGNSKAMEMYEKAIPLLKESRSIEHLSYTLHRKAQVLEKLGKNDEAFSLFEEAIGKLEKIRTMTTFSWMKKTFMEKVYEQYQETALFMLENDYNDKAFKYTGSMKARVFLDLLAEGLKKFEKGINRELQQKRDGLVAKLSLLSKEISEAAVKKDEKKLNLLKDKYSKIENEFEDLLVKIRLENPLYTSVQYPKPISVADLKKNILKANEVLIQYFITGEKVYVFLVSRKDFKVVALAIKEKDIQAVVNRYFIAVNKKDTGKMVEYGKKIYQAIFKPLETSLQMDKDIIIVPDRQLATIPFESFVIDDTNPNRVVYLLEKYRVKYIQSASALSFLRKYHKKKDGPSHFVGFGDPVYDYENFREGKPERGIPGPVKGDEIKEIHRGKYDREGGIYSRLQGSGQEVATITGLFKSKNQKGIVFLREQANEENAKAADMKEFDYIHFSCHGILGENFQSLVLSQIPDSKEDGYLTMNEIMNCDYNAKLVVLSACETGTGKMERAEGVTGLTRAFMYAGTPAVVASLWNVSDIGTKELMVKFYTNMLEKGMSKEEALRQAKLGMIKDGKYASPYFWSPFVMYGE